MKGERRKGGRGKEEKIRLPDIIILLGNSVRWNETSLLELERQGMSRLLRDEKDKAISTLASGQDFLAVLKRYTTF